MSTVDATDPVEEPTVKKQPKFDLSDGFGKEDIMALGGILWGWIKFNRATSCSHVFKA